MGCSNPHLIMDGKILRPEKINLNLDSTEKNSTSPFNNNTNNSSNNNNNKNINTHNKLSSSSSFPVSTCHSDLTHAQMIIHLITSLRNKIIYSHDKLVYDSGAFLFQKPTIYHCVRCIFFKMSQEVNGNFDNISFNVKEDPPYLQGNFKNLSILCQDLLTELFDFIIELKYYRVIIKQIDQEIPELFYLIFENKKNISKENAQKIQKAIELFKEMTKLRSSILQNYKTQIYRITTQNLIFWEKVIVVGKYAYKKNINDIYDIVMLNKYKKKFFENKFMIKNNNNNFGNNENDKNNYYDDNSADRSRSDYYGDEEGNDDSLMVNNATIAKKNMENKLKNEELGEEEMYFNKYIFGNLKENAKSADVHFD